MKTIDISDATDIIPGPTSTDMIEATLLTEPDPNWKFVDAQGHEHTYYRKYRSPELTLPTLVEIVDSPGHEFEDGDYYDYEPPVTHYECAKCGERVFPGRRPGESLRIPGFPRFGEIKAVLPFGIQDTLLELMTKNSEFELLHTAFRCTALVLSVQVSGNGVTAGFRPTSALTLREEKP